MLHVSATFKRDYTLEFYSNIIIVNIIVNNIDYKIWLQSMFFVAYTCNILHLFLVGFAVFLFGNLAKKIQTPPTPP